MEAFLCPSTAITTGHPLRSPLLARQAGASISGPPRTSLPVPLAAAPATGAVSRSRTPGLGFCPIRGHLLRAGAIPEDDSSTATFGYLAAAPKAGMETVKETTVEKDESEAPPAAVGDVPAVEKPSPIKFFDQLDIQLDSEETYYVLIYGTGAFVALWISSAIVGAIDSLPLFPKMMEIIGLGFTVWFAYRYLIFKKNRDELLEKIEHLKEQILGPSVE